MTCERTQCESSPDSKRPTNPKEAFGNNSVVSGAERAARCVTGGLAPCRYHLKCRSCFGTSPDYSAGRIGSEAKKSRITEQTGKIIQLYQPAFR
ncbi:MAG: hypothetical protein AAFV88_24165, partial [Planctomycetota bacterium]